jgi:hypothetical protein
MPITLIRKKLKFKKKEKKKKRKRKRKSENSSRGLPDQSKTFFKILF